MKNHNVREEKLKVIKYRTDKKQISNNTIGGNSRDTIIKKLNRNIIRSL